MLISRLRLVATEARFPACRWDIGVARRFLKTNKSSGVPVMFKHGLAIAVLAFSSLLASAAVEVNRADQAELEAVSGLGPQLAEKILAERRRGGLFKDWVDLIARVRGVGDRNAARFSAAGLRVEGKPDPYVPPPLPAKASHPARSASAASVTGN
jgi:competence protein ComEA